MPAPLGTKSRKIDMAQQFFINKGSTLPNLRMEVIHDGRYDFRKFYLALQNAEVTFTMFDQNTGIKKIVNAPADVVEKVGGGCEDGFVIEYKWKKRDTSEAGTYVGLFTIRFGDDLVMDGMSFPSGDMVAPIAEDLLITINDSGIKK